MGMPPGRWGALSCGRAVAAASMADLIGGRDARSRVRRLPEKAAYERSIIYEILDATTLCHVGVVVEGRPLVLPTLYVRHGDSLLLHGSLSSLLLRSAVALDEICIEVTLLEGIIAARSTFNSSMAYRSAVVFGPARVLEDPEDAERALEALVEGVLPGRSAELRPSTETELRRTRVVEVRIVEASAKISQGPPEDEPEDVLGGSWAGTIPLITSYGSPIPAPDGKVGQGEIGLPASVRRLMGE
jgi:nitroimidazol reductase NimA-like FMN-containing flavoprotein (pyridoxamine 5'-phosphate oxidase superfamily)